MSRVWSFVLGVITGAGLLYAAMHYHLIHSNDGWLVVAKSPARLAETIVDVRAYTMSDWTSHPQLAGALVQADKQHVLGESAASTFRQTVNQLLPQQVR